MTLTTAGKRQSVQFPTQCPLGRRRDSGSASFPLTTRPPEARSSPQSSRNGPESLQRRACSALRGVHGQGQPKSPPGRQPEREGAHRPAAQPAITCRPEQVGAQPQRLRGVPGFPPGRQGGPGSLLDGLLLPVEAALGELRGVAAARGAVLSPRGTRGAARQPGGGGEVGSRPPAAFCPATVPAGR